MGRAAIVNVSALMSSTAGEAPTTPVAPPAIDNPILSIEERKKILSSIARGETTTSSLGPMGPAWTEPSATARICAIQELNRLDGLHDSKQPGNDATIAGLPKLIGLRQDQLDAVPTTVLSERIEELMRRRRVAVDRQVRGAKDIDAQVVG